MNEPVVAWDTETIPFGPDAVAPRIVCWTGQETGGSPFLVANGDGDTLKEVLEISLRGRSVLHNAAFDLACACSTYPHLFPLVFKALEEGRVHDTSIREKLWNLGSSGNIEFAYLGDGSASKIDYSLAGLAKRLCGLDLSAGKDKDDAAYVRTSYAEMDGWESSDYPAEFRDYALLDAQATYEVFQAQEKRGAQFFKSEALHVKAAFCLYLMTAWGIKVDKEAKEKLQARVKRAISPDTLPLIYQAGIVIPALPPQPHARGAKDHVEGCKRKGCDCPVKMTKAKPERVAKKDALIPFVERIYERLGVEPKKTDPSDKFPEGQTSVAAETLVELMADDPTGVLEQFVLRERLVKLRSSYFPAMEWPYASGITANRVHPRYDPLKKTGRVSGRGNTKQGFAKGMVHYPSVAVQQAAGALKLRNKPLLVEGEPIRMRNCYVPSSSDWVLLACDYKAMELVSAAQVTLNMFGKSRLADQINRGWDPHCVVGSVLAYDYEEAFREFAGSNESHNGSEESIMEWCYNRFLAWKKVEPKLFKHYRTFAKPVGLGYPGGLGARTMVALCAGYGVKTSEKEAKDVRNTWLRIYPQMRHYLFRSAKDAIYARRKDRELRRYVTPSGMVRSGCSHTEWCNGNALQSPGAEGMKEATFLVMRACYDKTEGSVLYGNAKGLANMHDELLLEVRRSKMHECTVEVKNRMERGMKKIMTDVAVTAEPALMERWDKRAETVIDAQGHYTIWRPEEE